MPALIRRAPGLAVYAVGGPGGPARGTLDPDLLRWVEEHGCLLVTRDRASVPAHLAHHMASGRHVPGIAIVPRRHVGWGDVIDGILLLQAASPDELADQIVYLPL